MSVQAQIPMSTKQTTMPSISQSSSVEKEVKDLEDVVARAETNAKDATAWYLRLVLTAAALGLLAAIAVVIVFVTQYRANKREQEVSSRQKLLIAAKGRQNDLQMESIRQEAAIQIEDTKREAHREASEAQAKADAAHVELASARLKQQELQLATERLAKENTSAAATIEEEKRKRIQLAVSLLPRTFRDQSGAILRLQQFAGTVVAIGYLDEQEPLSVGEQVTFVLEHAGWKTYGMPLRNIWPSEGVRVYVRVKAGALVPGSDPASQTKAIAEYMRSERVGSLLVDELNKSGIDAKFSPGPRLPNVPDETLYISVGARPTSTLLAARV